MSFKKGDCCFGAIKKWPIALLMALLSGCVTQGQFNKQSAISYLKTITPQYAPIQNGHLEYYRFGQGTPIILIPGYVTDITSWDRRFLAALAKQHEVVVFNHRNVGGSLVRSDRYESQDLAKDTCQLIEQLQLKKPAVIGISMGGMIAQQLAVRYPNQIGPLILINTAIAGQQAIHPDPATEKKMLNIPTSKPGRYLTALKLFFPASERIKMGFSLALNRFQPAQYTEIDPKAVISQQRFLILQWAKDDATAQKTAQLKRPVLILNGEADQVIPPANSEILAHTLVHADLKRWQNGGHAMIYQYPLGIAKAVNEFIAKS